MDPGPASIEWGGIAGYAGLILLFSAYFLVLEGIFLSFARRTATRGQLHKRLSASGGVNEHADSLVKMRQRRSLSAGGDYILPLAWLNRLIVQSGVTWSPAIVPLVVVGMSTALLLIFWGISGSLPVAMAIVLFGGSTIILLVLVALRGKRRKKLEAQLPEAVDILVRGLKAGHPVSAAVRLVARELPDPMGMEFAIVADELTYGLDLETAMNNMSARVGQQDLALVVIAIGIQSRTGGNLAGILSGMSTLVRERLKLRLKVKALSAEGRFSGIVLGILPLALFALLWVIAPNFYGEVWNVPIVKPALAAAVVWMIVGQIVMYRMVKFEI